MKITIDSSISAYEAAKRRRQINGIKLNAMSREALQSAIANLIAEKYDTSVSFALTAIHKATL